jgi:uncharacterized membrane protein YoaK (UPF0700 family)
VSTAPAVTSLRHPLTRALLLLTASTGLIDAASYLGLGHVFAANMTGNIVLLGIEASLLAGAAVLAAAASVRPGSATGDCVIALLALGMGVRNATVRKLAVPDLTTTVLTMTLTGLAAESPLAGGDGSGTARRATAVLAMLVGALTGALLLKVDLWLVIVVACAATVVTFVSYRSQDR